MWNVAGSSSEGSVLGEGYKPDPVPDLGQVQKEESVVPTGVQEAEKGDNVDIAEDLEGEF